MSTKRWDAVVQKRYSHCCKLSDDRIILKYRGLHPILFFGYKTYSNDQIRAIIAADEEA